METNNKENYILITPAKNEVAYIEKTIESVVNQEILPKSWIIVSDGSSDGTDDIVKKYCQNFKFIKLIRRETNSERNFASKVNSIKEAFCHLRGINYEFYGNLDGDVSFGSNYYRRLIEKFRIYPNLGVAGGKVYDYYGGKFHKQISGLHSVAGPIQFFRRKCWEDIGGYVESKVGLIDAIAEISARMNKWETRSFAELKVLHHRSTGSEGRNIWKVAIRQGQTDYLLGYHPVWQLARSLQRINKRPILIGSVLRTINFIWHYLKNAERPVTKEFIKFLRSEELNKIRNNFLFS